MGKEVSTLVNETQPVGDYVSVLNKKELKAGVYFYVFKVGDFIETKRMVIE
ncbi:MAG: T9SS type A sorting domain-containing protein [Flavobacteriales bacterium]|nr:T9SS type A sorting domain-containing protein [Flavobacteriales bacterium]